VTKPTYEAPAASAGMMDPIQGSTFLSPTSYRDPRRAEALQFDLYKFSQSNVARSNFDVHRKTWRNLRSIYSKCEKDGDLGPFKKALAGLLNRSPKPVFEAIARDALELVNRNFLHAPKAQLRWAEIVALSKCEASLF
jgi:hypothetical protein